MTAQTVANIVVDHMLKKGFRRADIRRQWQDWQLTGVSVNDVPVYLAVGRLLDGKMPDDSRQRGAL